MNLQFKFNGERSTATNGGRSRTQRRIDGNIVNKIKFNSSIYGCKSFEINLYNNYDL